MLDGTKRVKTLFHSISLSLINRPSVLEYGMWDQIRVDHGNEFYLLLYVQEKMANYRTNTGRAPFIQTMSKEVSLYIALETRLEDFNKEKRN